MPATFQLSKLWLEPTPACVALEASVCVDRTAKSVWNLSVIGTCTSP